MVLRVVLSVYNAAHTRALGVGLGAGMGLFRGWLVVCLDGCYVLVPIRLGGYPKVLGGLQGVSYFLNVCFEERQAFLFVNVQGDMCAKFDEQEGLLKLIDYIANGLRSGLIPVYRERTLPGWG